MSIRAYRVVKKELASYESFNTSHDTDLMGFLQEDSGFFEATNCFGAGMIEVPVSKLRKAVTAFPWEPDDHRKVAIMADIAWAEERQEEFVTYDCF